MATHGVTLDLLAQIGDQLAVAAPALADPDMAITTSSASSPPREIRWQPQRSLSATRKRCPNLLQIFSTSQYLSDLLVVDHEAYDLLR